MNKFICSLCEARYQMTHGLVPVRSPGVGDYWFSHYKLALVKVAHIQMFIFYDEDIISVLLLSVVTMLGLSLDK